MEPINTFLRKVEVVVKENPEVVGAAAGALVLGAAIPVLGHVAGAVIGAAAGAAAGKRMRRGLE